MLSLRKECIQVKPVGSGSVHGIIFVVCWGHFSISLGHLDDSLSTLMIPFSLGSLSEPMYYADFFSTGGTFKAQLEFSFQWGRFKSSYGSLLNIFTGVTLRGHTDFFFLWGHFHSSYCHTEKFHRGRIQSPCTSYFHKGHLRNSQNYTVFFTGVTFASHTGVHLRFFFLGSLSLAEVKPFTLNLVWGLTVVNWGHI